MTRSGGRLVVDQLVVHGARRCFGVPGESYLAVLDGLYDVRDRLEFVPCRMEAGAANMAEAHGKLTGTPGVCLVTRGPGATHATAGVHTAQQDSTPMLLLVGDVARSMRGREAFQEVDFPAFFGPLAKWAVAIEDAARIPEILSRAHHVATSGRPGPVVVALPEDMLTDEVDVPDAEPYRAVQAAPDPDDVEAVLALLAGAERPLIVAGGTPWSQAASDALQAFAEASEIPVAASFRRQDHIDNLSPVYCGDLGLGVNPALAARVRESDVLVLLGSRLGEVPSGGYKAVGIPRRAGTLAHVLGSPEELNRVYEADVAALAAPDRFAVALAEAGPATGGEGRRGWRESARADFEAWSEPSPRDVDGVDLAHLMLALRDQLPDDAIVCNGAGNFTVWVHRFHRHRRYGTQLAPTSGAMGYGVPAAIAAAAEHPERTVVCVAGDGDFLMTGQELATAAQHGLRLVVVIADNGMYGTIRLHQERHYPGRVSGTDLWSPDFAALARAFGAHAELIERDADIPGALARALAHAGPAVVHLRTDRRALTPAVLLDRAAGQSGPAH